MLLWFSSASSYQYTNNASFEEQHTHECADGYLQNVGTAPENNNVGLETWKCARSLQCAALRQSESPMCLI